MKIRLKWMVVPGLLLSTSLYGQGSCSHLQRAYPGVVSCAGSQVNIHGRFKTINHVPFDDGRSKTFDERLNHPDIEDMFYVPYKRGKTHPPTKNYDPGRIRYEPLFRAMYGNSSADVRRNLTTVNWFGRRVRVTRINGVDQALRAVEKDLEKAIRRNPRLRKYLTPIGGTFKWRKIAGTNRLSVHSFGAAIDINVKYSAYWRWNKGPYKYRNQIPSPIVDAFERHCFIWGGKWYHYDTMHFEYRPELLPGCRQSGYTRSSSHPLPPKQHTSPAKKNDQASQKRQSQKHGDCIGHFDESTRIYTVGKDETLWKISGCFTGHNMNKIKDRNRHDIPNDKRGSIRPGMKLWIEP